MSFIIGAVEEKKEIRLFNANGYVVESAVVPAIVETETVAVNEKESDMTEEQALQLLADLTAQLEALKGTAPETHKSTEKKNQKASRPKADRKYVLLDKELRSWGKVPQQQADIAALLVKNLEVGVEYTEEAVFNLLEKKYVEYGSLAGSTQDPTYLFRYYRGLKNDGKHAGYIARNFLQML